MTKYAKGLGSIRGTTPYSTTRSDCWCFTNHDVEEIDDDAEIDFHRRLKSVVSPIRSASDHCPDTNKWCNYVVYGREFCPKTCKYHLQGYLQLQARSTRRCIQARLGVLNLHLEPSKSGPEENISYCKKDGDWCELGTPRFNPTPKGGTGAEAGAIKKEIIRLIKEENHGIDELLEQFPTHWDFICKANRLRHRRSGRAFCLYLHGSPGSGKTFSTELVCKELGLTCYKKCPGNKWFDGYEGEDVIMFEEFTSCVTCSTFLSLCDGKPPLMENKGGNVSISSPVYIFCTNIAPEDQYPDLPVVRKKAFLRRLDQVTCTDDFTVVVEPPLYRGGQNRLKTTPVLKEHTFIEQEIKNFLQSFHPKLQEKDDGFKVEEFYCPADHVDQVIKKYAIGNAGDHPHCNQSVTGEDPEMVHPPHSVVP